jgi:uncharacterized iron-regulated protein
MKRVKYSLLLIIFTVFSLGFVTGDLPAYKIYSAEGENSSFENLLNDALNADIIFFGEMHNNPICHWLQLELTKDLYKENTDNLVLGAEMFEADDQIKIDEYFSDFISQKSFEEEARLWKNYQTDYKPIVEFAKGHKLKFTATNIPRRYASLVAKRGFPVLDSLSTEAKSFMAKLPIDVDWTLPGYKELKDMSSGMGMHGMEMMSDSTDTTKTMTAENDTTKTEDETEMKEMMATHEIAYLAEAQAVKDATMANFILKNFKDGNTFLHFNGSRHTEDFEGIVWFIKKNRPDLKVMTIASTEQASVDTLATDSKNSADYILVVPEDMTKTYKSSFGN